MPEGQEADLCGQAHSHVNMGTTPSSVDTKQQKAELENKTGFYLFQIWNKKLDINTFLYDIDNGIEYERDDVELIIEDDEFTTMSHTMLVEPPKPTYPSYPVVPPVEHVENWGQKWRDQSFFDDYWPGYGQEKEKPTVKLNTYEIQIEGKNVKVVYVVEAPSKEEAAELFWYWAYENADFVASDLEEEDDDVYKIIDSCEISEPVESKEEEIVDVSYDELLMCCENWR